MINFHPEIAHDFIVAASEGNTAEAAHLLNALALDAQVSLPLDCQEFCPGGCIRYNYPEQSDESLEELRGILTRLCGASHGEAFGVLAPRFFCVAEQWLQAAQKETSDGDGELSSEPIE